MCARSKSSPRLADWLTYDIPRTIAGRAWKGRYRGQRQKWYAMRFTGKDERDQRRKPRRPQAGVHRLALGADEESARLIVPFKRPVYERVVGNSQLSNRDLFASCFHS